MKVSLDVPCPNDDCSRELTVVVDGGEVTEVSDCPCGYVPTRDEMNDIEVEALDHWRGRVEDGERDAAMARAEG